MHQQLEGERPGKFQDVLVVHGLAHTGNNDPSLATCVRNDQASAEFVGGGRCEMVSQPLRQRLTRQECYQQTGRLRNTLRDHVPRVAFPPRSVRPSTPLPSVLDSV